jgi:hypothetical protein
MAILRLTAVVTQEQAEDCLEKACGGKVLQKAEPKDDTKEKPDPVDADVSNDPDEVKKGEDTEDTGDDDDTPDFDDEEFEDTPEYKAFAPLVLQAYKFWLGHVKGDKESKKGYEWAKPEKNERPKEFAERVADHLESTKEGKDIQEIVGEGADYYDFVESIMYFSDLDKKEVAKSLYDDGTFAAMLADEDSVEKSLSTGMTAGLSDDEALDIAKIQLKGRARLYSQGLELQEKYAEEQAKKYHNPSEPHYMPEPQEPSEFVDGAVESVISDIVWSTKEYGNTCLYLKIARHLEGIPNLEKFVRQTLWEALYEFDVVDAVPSAE